MIRCGILSLRKLSKVIKILIFIILILSLLIIIKTHSGDGSVTPATFLALVPMVSNATNLRPTTLIEVPIATDASIVLGPCEVTVSALLARRFPHIIIIGFGKAGTRAVYNMIRMHPSIVGSSHEIRFFSNVENYKRGMEFYMSQLPATNASQKTIVKSPDYIINRKAVSRLKKAILHCNRTGNIKFIVVLRDPFTRAVSEYLHWQKYLLHTRKEMLQPFEKLCIDQNSGEVDSHNKQVNASIYSYHVQYWTKYFNIRQICFVNGETLVKNPYLELKTLEKCLELRSFFQPRHFYYSEAKGFFCPVDLEGHPVCLSPAKGRRHPNIDEDVERKLRQFYEPFNKRLYNITGVDYGWT